ncbi:MAG: CHAT domain-containing protein, partial [Bacteroidota bacterium]
KAMNAYMVYENSKAKELFSKFITDTESFQKYSLRYYRASAYYLMATMAYSEYNNKVALVNAKRGLEEAKKLSNPIELEATLMYLKMSYEQQLGLNEDMMQTSSDLLVLANTIDSDLYKAQAHNTIGNYYLNSPYPNERSQAASNIFDAISYAEKGGYTELASSIKGNYVLVLWQAGRKNEAIAISNELFNDAYTKGKYSTAEVTANNMGFMYYMENEYSNAATFFQKAIDMTEDVRSALKPKERLALMNGHSSSYSGLVMSLQKLGDSKRLFEVQEMNRSRYLRDRLLPNSKAATLAEAQAMLKPGEVLLYYSLTAPGEIIINAITQNSSKIYYSYLLDEWIRLKKSYTDRQKQIPSAFNQFMSDYANDMADGYMIRYADKSQNLNSKDFKVITEWTRQLLEDSSSDLTGVRNDFLKVWYQATLAPIQELKSASNVIIGASNELNLLPFEAFMDGTGNYFIKNHSVRYIPSVSIWKLLQNRNYAGNRKPALCMGGAIYQPSGNVKGTVRGIDDFYGITESMELKMSKGDYNFSNELGQLGMGGANYLPGTLREVQFVGQLSPDIKVLTGMEMKESALKQMNKTGELKQYEALLISTHGFAYDIIPDLSGVMMSQPDNGDGNEDMFLLAPEIAQLDLNADIAILSACSTALGSIAGGEGVNGLNSAFLVAGANNTLLSLWPVNDSSTALTMQSLFKLRIENGMDSFTAINLVKRAMANGEAGAEFSKPSYWAPFVLNGR